MPRDRRVPALAVGAHGFLLQRGQAALGIARRKTAVPERSVVAGRLFDACQQRRRELRAGGALRHDVFAADQFACLFKNAARPSLHEMIESQAHRGVRRDAARRIRSSAHRADDQLAHRHGGTGHGSDLLPRGFNPAPALGDGRARAALLLDHQHIGGASRGPDFLQKLRAIEALASQRDEQHGAHIRMRAKLPEHAMRVGIWIAPWKAHEMHARFAKRIHHLARYMMRAFDQIGDDHDIADALAPVGAQVAGHRKSVLVLTSWFLVLHRHSSFPAILPLAARKGGQVIAAEVVGVNMLPGGDFARGGTDRRAVFDDLFAGSDWARGNLMPERQGGGDNRFRAFNSNARPSFERANHREHVIGGVQPEKARIVVASCLVESFDGDWGRGSGWMGFISRFGHPQCRDGGGKKETSRIKQAPAGDRKSPLLRCRLLRKGRR